MLVAAAGRMPLVLVQQLPEEVLLNVLGRLEATSLLRLASTSSFFLRLATSAGGYTEQLWASLCARATPPWRSEPGGSMATFRRRAVAERGWATGRFRLHELRGATGTRLAMAQVYGAGPQRQLLAVNDDGRCILWAVADGSPLGSAPAPDISALLPSFARHVRAPSDLSPCCIGCRVIETSSGTERTHIRVLLRPQATDWDCSDRHFLGVVDRCTIAIYDQSGKQLAVCEGHTRPISGFGLVHGCSSEQTSVAEVAVSASNDGTCRAWHVPSGRCMAIVSPNDPVRDDGRGGVLCLVLDRNRRLAVAGTVDGDLWLFNIPLSDDGSIVAVVPQRCRPIVCRAHIGPVLCIDADWSLKRVCTGSRDGTAKVWSLSGDDFEGGHNANVLQNIVTLDPQARPGSPVRARPLPVRSVRVDCYGVLTMECASALLYDFGVPLPEPLLPTLDPARNSESTSDGNTLVHNIYCSSSSSSSSSSDDEDSAASGSGHHCRQFDLEARVCALRRRRERRALRRGLAGLASAIWGPQQHVCARCPARAASSITCSRLELGILRRGMWDYQLRESSSLYETTDSTAVADHVAEIFAKAKKSWQNVPDG